MDEGADLGDVITNAIARAAHMRLHDAAYSLWIQKWQLDREQGLHPQPQPADLSDPKTFAQAVRAAFLQVDAERRNAHEGTTFDRLKASHPEANDEELRGAIRAAVKFGADCTRFFFYSDAGLFEDGNRAVSQALVENPGFGGEAADCARHYLYRVMR